MRNVNLEENELTITAIFQQHTKEETIQTLKEAWNRKKVILRMMK